MRGLWGGGSEGEREIKGKDVVGRREGEKEKEAGGEQEEGREGEGVGRVEGGRELEGRRDVNGEKFYTVLTYYIPQTSSTTWITHFPIIWDLDLCRQVLIQVLIIISVLFVQYTHIVFVSNCILSS